MPRGRLRPYHIAEAMASPRRNPAGGICLRSKLTWPEACRMSAWGVRRAKAALSSGCKPHPATAPAGSNRSSYGGDEIAEAFGMRATNRWQRECAGRNASERRASLEKDDAQAGRLTWLG